ncbi:adenylate/guanylate cyclase domain-containing protein [Rhizobium sp. TRM95111]|uniref:adenylate/guanylate cyclase domain-containing protein n=1 Tax=Rhizobium alarense TaxID=2846851 RepID=UPI001F402C3D|nr:adenylate/guanylate cyclase domain-containing protein [Rhizobium alarense]MCF3641434.1 adenylate/guanylate cyclase domain-containing protein [Rhizobium alarense]
MKIIARFSRRKAHLLSGAVLGVFVLTHFANHALGLISVELMELARHPFNAFWRSWPGTVALYGALTVHFVLALDSLYRRRTLRMPAAEAAKIVLGLALPFLILPHVVATRVEHVLTGFDVGYPEMLRNLWASTGNTVRQSVALLVAWSHACLGMWFWMRGRSWFPRYAVPLYTFAAAMPVLALLGFYTGARLVPPAVPSDSWFRAFRADPKLLGEIRLGLTAMLASLVGLTFILRALPASGRVRVRYPNGKVVTVDPGFSVLEASRSAGIPHAAICGGRGRCSTCRVRVLDGLENLPPPGQAEQATLARIGAPATVRLACQLRPTQDLTVSPLIDVENLGLGGRVAGEDDAGRERRVVVLFCDIRQFTTLAEQKLPYDTVFLLNRYFAVVGEAVRESGGAIDKFVGDGAIALFGLDTGFDAACRQALRAAQRIAEGVENLSRTLKADLDQPLRIAMGLHGGPAVVGRIGHGQATSLTAIGDTINTASRLEGLAKQHDVELAVSSIVVDRAGVVPENQERQEISLRGRTAPLETWIIRHVRELALPGTPAA